MNLELPIQDCFDLIIGTRYNSCLTTSIFMALSYTNISFASGGGIVALGLGIRRMSVHDSREMFRNLASKAFVKRTGLTLPVVSFFVEAQNQSQYHTAGLKSALMSSLGEGRIFGETHNWSSCRKLNVGVTATSSTGHPYFVANYNRARENSLSLRFPTVFLHLR